jgi:hypothetical protein
MEEKKSSTKRWKFKLGTSILVFGFAGSSLLSTHYSKLLAGSLAQYSKLFLIISILAPLLVAFTFWSFIDPIRAGKMATDEIEGKTIYVSMIYWCLIFSFLAFISVGLLGATLKIRPDISQDLVFSSSIILFLGVSWGLVKEVWYYKSLNANNLVFVFLLGYGAYASMLGPYLFFFPWHPQDGRTPLLFIVLLCRKNSGVRKEFPLKPVSKKSSESLSHYPNFETGLVYDF